jgi:amino acid adenylation domain-containing protein
VPLDPSYPRERVEYLLQDAAPKVVLIQEGLREMLPTTDARLISLDSEWSEIAQLAGSDLSARELGLTPHHLAYVIYTSGSTGQPKGVLVEHRNVVRLFAATQEQFHFNAQDVWTLFHSIAFDFSVWELWGALLHGGRVVVVSYVTARSPQAFYRLLCDEGVTVLNQTPTAFRQVIAQAQESSQGSPDALRVVIFGGEALELHTLQGWVESRGAERPQLVNMYGITETTVHVTYRRLSESEIALERSGVVGRSLSDLRVYLLDAHRQPVPIGVAGEIYVGGAGVARGYLNREALTAERFVTDPFSEDTPASRSVTQARLYKTGDMGRWRADGELEYLGRNDHQVKIRGYRIELGEIEAQLSRHAQVKEAVVLARETASGEKRLVAYVTRAVPTEELQVEDLRRHLQAVLPEYMVPGAYVVLESLPLTANGKLDRKALPAPNLEAYGIKEYVAPRNSIEASLCDLWKDVLQLQEVGVNDNFFDLGGSSLNAVLVVQRMQRDLKLKVSVIQMFTHPTVGHMAEYLTNADAEETHQREVSWDSSRSQALQTRRDSMLRRRKAMSRGSSSSQ